MAVHELRPPAEAISQRPARAEAAPAPRDALWRDQLRHILDRDLLPRLAILGAASTPAARTPYGIEEPEVAEFTGVLLSGGLKAGFDTVAALQARRVSLEKIYLELFAPAANRLGELWVRDTCDFFEVSVALHRLKQLFDSVRPRRDGYQAGGLSRRVLLATAPGETHTFGTAVVAEFFTVAGWDAAQCHDSRHSRLLASQWFDVAGFSLSSGRSLKALKAAIATARRVSRNQAIGVIVGGHFFNDRQGLAEEVGADGTAADAETAVALARSLLKVQQHM